MSDQVATPPPVVAVVCVAMPEEAAPFLAQGAVIGQPARLGNAQAQRIDVSGRQIVLVRTGIGYVNAASGLTAVIAALRNSRFAHAAGLVHETAAQYAPVVISAGSAGGIHRDIRVGEIVAGNRFVHSAADATAFGYELGQVPGMPVEYHADEAVLALVRQTRDDSPVRHGLMLSSDVFVSTPRVAPTREQWPDALSVDMETGALAQTSYSLGVPFVSIRAVSDLCGPSEFDTHVDDAADRSASVVLDLIERLSQ